MVKHNPHHWLILWLWICITTPTIALEKNIDPIPSPPDIQAKAYVLMDAHSHDVLAEKNADLRLEPASLTKMLTVYVADLELARGRIHLNDWVTVSPHASRAPGSRMFLEPNSHVQVDTLLHGIIIQSGNDASIALAEYIAGSEAAFAELMNQVAKHLGMEHSHFVDATGLTVPDHYTTARDLAILAEHVVLDFPQTYAIYHQKEFTYHGIHQSNRNRLLWSDADVDGIKTGHTDAAGYCLTASSEKHHMRLVSVVLGTHSDRARTEANRQLLTYGFRFFETHQLYQADVPFIHTHVWYSQSDQVPIGLAHDLWITIPSGHYQDVRIKALLDEKISAPIAFHQVVGSLQITVPGKQIIKLPLVTLATAKRGPVWSRTKDFLRWQIQKVNFSKQPSITPEPVITP